MRRFRLQPNEHRRMINVFILFFLSSTYEAYNFLNKNKMALYAIKTSSAHASNYSNWLSDWLLVLHICLWVSVVWCTTLCYLRLKINFQQSAHAIHTSDFTKLFTLFCFGTTSLQAGTYSFSLIWPTRLTGNLKPITYLWHYLWTTVTGLRTYTTA